MTKQYVVFGLPTPVFFNESTSSSFALPGVFVNAASGSIGGAAPMLPVMGVGARQPNAVDLLVSGALFAGLLVKENPVVGRRSIFVPGPRHSKEVS